MAKRITTFEQDKVFIDRYLNGESALSIAKSSQISINLVLARLREAGLVIRHTGRQPQRTLGLTETQLQKFLEMTDGLLLGDASVDQKGVFRLSQCLRRGAWIEQIQAELLNISVSSKIGRTPPGVSKKPANGRYIKSSGSVYLYTPACVETKALRKRWYPEGKKIIPRDVSLTPLSIALWLCGDGTTKKTGLISFCTNGFTYTDVEYLRFRLYEILGVNMSIVNKPDGPVLESYRRNESNRIKIYTQDYVPEVFKYKLSSVRPAIPKGQVLRRFTPQQITEMRILHTQGLSKADLWRRFGTSQTTIGKIMDRKLYVDVP